MKTDKEIFDLLDTSMDDDMRELIKVIEANKSDTMQQMRYDHEARRDASFPLEICVNEDALIV